MAEAKTTIAEPEVAAQEPSDLFLPGVGRRGTCSIKDLFGKHKDDPIFHEVWEQTMRDREAYREAAV